jgi:hypothetical protein
LLPAQMSFAQGVCTAACAGNPTLAVTAGSSAVILSQSSPTLAAAAQLTGGSDASGTITFTLT